MLHLVISGPMLGRGEEFCRLFRERVLDASGDPTFVVFWMYAGSFNLMHSSDKDLRCLRELVNQYAPRTRVVETSLKSGAWMGKAKDACIFWGLAFPSAWNVEQAKGNPMGFDVSTDIQSINMFLRSFSSQPGRGLKWIFQKIAEARIEDGPKACSKADHIQKLLRDMEMRNLMTNLTITVPPTASSLAKVREALFASSTVAAGVGEADESVTAARLDDRHRRALAAVDEVSKPGPEACADSLVAKALDAAQDYAKLYQGNQGRFLEAGCTEYFPKEKPTNGPRLDKRSILRSMAQKELHGGPTADVLVLFLLILFREEMERQVAVAVEAWTPEDAEPPVANALSQFSNVTSTATVLRPTFRGLPAAHLPEATRKLFQLVKNHRIKGSFYADLAQDVEMSEATKAALIPLVDAAVDSILVGARLLHTASTDPSWGRSHRESPDCQ